MTIKRNQEVSERRSPPFPLSNQENLFLGWGPKL